MKFTTLIHIYTLTKLIWNCDHVPEDICCFWSVANATRDPTLYKCCSGLCIDLLRLLSDKIGFDYELFEVEDEKWGAYDKVRTFSFSSQPGGGALVRKFAEVFMKVFTKCTSCLKGSISLRKHPWGRSTDTLMDCPLRALHLKWSGVQNRDALWVISSRHLNLATIHSDDFESLCWSSKNLNSMQHSGQWEGGGRKAEGGERRAEGGGRRAEGGGRRAVGGERWAESEGRRAEGRSNWELAVYFVKS